MKENSKIFNKQNFLICDTAEYCTMNLSDINPERIRHLETSNRIILKYKFMSEKKRKYKNKQNNVLNTDNKIIIQ